MDGLGQAEPGAEDAERPRSGRGGRERSHGKRRDGRERRRPAEERREPAARPLREAPRPITMEPEGKVLPLPVRREERWPEDDLRVVGFGDHLPAFLARPARIARG
jgi:hypothetical protein